jgi:hypothetical protein
MYSGKRLKPVVLPYHKWFSNFNVKINTPQKESSAEMVTFKDQNPSYCYEVGNTLDSTYKVVDNDDADLGNFFARPVKIQSFNWATSTTLFEKFNPWQDYFENPRVMNRISNFALMRAKLHVKFVINGNGFHYGRLISSYIPLPAVDDFTVDRAFFQQDIVQASQRPHLYLDPTTSQGGEMVLPYFWYDNYLSIPSVEWRQMGDMIIHTLQGLKHANGATDSVTISVFAWAEDVALSVPTSAEPFGLTPQMGKEDEYGRGVISRPASVVARVAGGLRSAPYIGNYARATEIAANAVSAVATTFGYSRPTNLEHVNYYRPTVMGNLANVNVPDSCQRLTLDAKQELTVDPTTVGLGPVDEMTISSIASRESYLTQFPWAVAATTEQMLWQTQVTPYTWAVNTLSAEPEMHIPACMFAALPFQNWYGSMKYRFQIVSSNYHKGRIKIVYDPHGFQSNEYNTNYTYIIDIAEEKDFTVQIGWGSDKPYCISGAPGAVSFIDATTVPYDTIDAPVVPLNRANGMLRVYVVNELTVPNSTIDNDISLNVFVAAGDDMQFRNPSDALEQYSHFSTPQMGFEPQHGVEGDVDETSEPSKPMSQQVDHEILSKVSTTDAYDHVFYGESIVSFRSLLKRYSQHTFEIPPDDDGTMEWSLTKLAFPYYKGYAPGAITPNGTPNNYNYSRMTMLNYLTPAYVGWRGSLRWKTATVAASTSEINNATPIRVTREVAGQTYSNTSLLHGSDAGFALSLMEGTKSTLTGAAYTHDNVCPTLEFEIPFQQTRRFAYAKRADWTTNSALGNAFTMTQLVGKGINSKIASEQMCSTGEDYSLFFFTGSPILYFDVAQPAL